MVTSKINIFDHNTHRRILEFSNAARRADDLTVLPEREIRVDEPRMLKGPDPHDLADRRAPTRKPTALLDLKAAKRLFEVGTAQAGDIARASLVRPMAVTHQTDTEQRVIQLEGDARDENTLGLRAPDGWHPPAMAPAGRYMPFIIDRAGVPSKARFIRLH